MAKDHFRLSQVQKFGKKFERNVFNNRNPFDKTNARKIIGQFLLQTALTGLG